MLSIQTQQKYIKKQIRLPDGSLALVVFELVNIDGRMTAKAVYGEILSHTVKKQETVALPVYFDRVLVKPLISPFFSYVSTILKDLSFIVSQPTCAPNFS
ncbi:MAG: hypothetical protein WCX27_02830 [Candidatus Paceibacterota bacterium]|jgi:hypothetical protein